MTDSDIGKTCPYCKFPLKADAEVVYCPACKVSHHRECWEQNGKCTTFGCRETIYQSVTKDRLEISFDEPSSREPALALAGSVNKMLAVALVLSLLVIIGLIAGYAEFFNIRRAEPVDSAAPVSPGSVSDPGGDAVVPPQTYAPSVIAALNADYYIDYEHGTIPISDLPIGVRVVDPSWEWEFRTGNNYSGSGKVKSVIWILVAKNHYEGLEPQVTLLAEELIGKHTFDNSTNRESQYGSNHWGDSGTANATRGLRPWLNSTGNHSGEGFYRAFSESFKGILLDTTVPNREWKNGNDYSTSDHVFIPSSTELGYSTHIRTYKIGTAYAYFSESDIEKRIAVIGGKAWHYWTRSPDLYDGHNLHSIGYGGEINYGYGSSDFDVPGVRPALNLKAGILVSEIKN